MTTATENSEFVAFLKSSPGREALVVKGVEVMAEWVKLNSQPLTPWGERRQEKRAANPGWVSVPMTKERIATLRECHYTSGLSRREIVELLDEIEFGQFNQSFSLCGMKAAAVNIALLELKVKELEENGWMSVDSLLKEFMDLGEDAPCDCGSCVPEDGDDTCAPLPPLT